MSSETPATTQPIVDVADLPPELQKKFIVVFLKAHKLEAIDESLESARATAVARFHKTVSKEVKAHPIFARTVFQEYTLLDIICARVGGAGLETIQFLIEANPDALLHRNSDDRTAIHFLAYSGWGCELLPWVMERHPWIFQHELCQQNPPHLEMAISYVNGICDLELVRRAYESYPQWLKERSYSERTLMDYPLTACLRGREEPDADFFIWMARQYPDAVYLTLEGGFSVLHMVCDYLTGKYYTPNMAQICRFLINEHAGLIHRRENVDVLPIYMLARRCNRPLVQEVAVLLLKAFPECVQVKVAEPYAQLSTFPFIHKVHPLVVEELEIDHEMTLLTELSKNVAKAAVLPAKQSTFASAPNDSVSNSSLLASLSEVFCSWASLRASDVLGAKRKRIQESIADTCRLLEGDDSDESEDEEDSNEDLASEGDDDDSDNTAEESLNEDNASVSWIEEDDEDPDESNEEDDLNEDSASDVETNGGRKRKR